MMFVFDILFIDLIRAKVLKTIWKTMASN